MKNTLLALALVSVAGIPVTALAQEPAPFEVSYQWSLSGKQYLTASRPLKTFDAFSFDVVSGYELNAVAPSFGFGASYLLEDTTGFYLKAGAFVLFPQQAKADVGFGVTFGVRF